jgi:hypothetical protein
MMVLYMVSRTKFMCLILTSASPSNSISRAKDILFLDDLLQMINDIIFDNPFAN